VEADVRCCYARPRPRPATSIRETDARTCAEKGDFETTGEPLDPDRKPATELLTLLYVELRKLAEARMARLPPGQTLQPTGLVHEAYLKLVGNADPGWDGPGHFFGAAARAMREILVDIARRKATTKHGGDRQRKELEEVDELYEVDERSCERKLAVHEAVRRLEAQDPRKGEIVNLRFFAQLTNEETAAVMGLPISTIEREWRYSKALLNRELKAAGLGGDIL
jgi:RNA polymerase sigma factor (TIGR02999 family)